MAVSRSVRVGSRPSHRLRCTVSVTASTTNVLTEIADLVATGQIEIPIAARYPLEQVQAAFAVLEQRHTHGKIVLTPTL
jgi:NADPH:quinone reductase